MRRQSAVFASVPVGAAVEDFRARHHPRAIARKLPPHVTILPPFTREVDEDDVLAAELTSHFAACPGFAAELGGVGMFRRHVWLAPAPADCWLGLVASTRDRFPHLNRDAREPAPHLTIAEIGRGESTRGVFEEAQEELAPLLPVSFEVRDVGLFEVRREGWHEVRRFRLG